MATLRSKIIRLAHDNPDLRPHLLAFLKKAAPMPEAEFWKVVEPYGWGTKTTDYKKIKKDLISRFSLEESESLSETFKAIKGRLYKALDRKVSGVGDDSFDDLLSHIIGMGKKEYDAVMKNPALAQDRVNRRDFVESFSYALPYSNDYAKTDISYYIGWAERQVSEYEELAPAWKEMGLVPDKNLKGALDKVVKALRGFIKDKDIKKFLETEKEVRDAVGVVMKASQGNPWGVYNLYTDLKEMGS